MKRSTRIVGSSTGLLAAAAFAGLIAGASHRASAASLPSGVSPSAVKAPLATAKAGVQARPMDAPTTQHDCKGKNDCKGQGGCGSSDNGCKGKNSCKGKGGCNTSGGGVL